MEVHRSETERRQVRMSTLTVVRHARRSSSSRIRIAFRKLARIRRMRCANIGSRPAWLSTKSGQDRSPATAGTCALALQHAVSPTGTNTMPTACSAGIPPPSSFPDNRAFQKVFEAAMSTWLEGSANAAEPWTAFFATACCAACGRSSRARSNRRVALFTSGGPIGSLSSNPRCTRRIKVCRCELAGAQLLDHGICTSAPIACPLDSFNTIRI